MTKNKTALFLLFILLSLTLFGCAKENERIPKDFFPVGTAYHIGMKCSTVQTRAQICFDRDGTFRLLHEDPSSPLFGLEEVFTEENVKSYFFEIEFETPSYIGGVANVFQALRYIKDHNPDKIKENDGVITYTYNDENTSFDFCFHKASLRPISVYGKINDKSFDINFSSMA